MKIQDLKLEIESMEKFKERKCLSEYGLKVLEEKKKELDANQEESA